MNFTHYLGIDISKKTLDAALIVKEGQILGQTRVANDNAGFKELLFEHPRDFGYNVPDSEKYPYYSPKEVVEVSGPIESLVDFAEEHGVSYAQLKGANLWLRDSKLTNASGKTYRIVIPR